MKFLGLFLVVLGLCLSSVHADAEDYTARTFVVTVSPTAQKRESVYTVAGALTLNDLTPVTLPILLGTGNKAYVLSIEVQRNDSGAEPMVHYRLQDPSVIIPGGGNNSGDMATLFEAWFPYSTAKIPIYSDSDNGTIFAQIVEGKPAPAAGAGK
ncbi:MAG TPA: hypothetical protein VIM48_11400 [Chthoniobacterales bacterium]